MSHPDPYLRAHCSDKHPRLFELGLGIWPISIRDQIIRAVSIVDRAIDNRFIHPTEPLFVAGAGVCGVAASLRAAQKGVLVVMVDREYLPFSRQRTCFTRWISPTQYDWPHTNWTDERFPRRAKNVPLNFRSNVANVLAAQWFIQFKRFRQANPGRIIWRPQTEFFDAVPDPDDMSRVRVKLPYDPSIPRSYSMVMNCIGVGKERTYVSQFDSVRFWDTDALQFAHQNRKWSRILIGGSGDGALQDFLRITTGLRSAKELYERLGLDQILTSAQLVDIFGKEDWTTRDYLWAMSFDHSCQSQRDASTFYRTLTRELFHPHHNAKLVDRLDKIVPSTMPKVQLVFPCRHFSKSYALNHFLAHVIGRYIKLRTGKHPFRRSTMIGDVLSADSRHTCALKPSQCEQYPHKVDFVRGYHCDSKLTKPALGGTEEFDLVLLRLGLEPEKPILQSRPYVSRRHLLPFE
jgi:hypothetical protein